MEAEGKKVERVPWVAMKKGGDVGTMLRVFPIG